jgi:hypothetical protein
LPFSFREPSFYWRSASLRAGRRREEFLFKRAFDGTAEAGALIPSEAKAKRSKEQKQEAKSRSERNGIKKQEKRNQKATESKATRRVAFLF